MERRKERRGRKNNEETLTANEKTEGREGEKFWVFSLMAKTETEDLLT